MSSINRALENDDPASTLEAIKEPTISIRSITDNCTESYHEKLRAARQEKVEKGLADNEGWSAHSIRGGYTYYYNSQSGVGQWAEPEGFTGDSQDLSRDEIQVKKSMLSICAKFQLVSSKFSTDTCTIALDCIY